MEVASPLDYEEKSQYSVTIKSTDNGGLSFSKSFIFKVLNLNEKPNNISLNPKEVRYFAKNEFFVLKLYMYTMKWLNLGSDVLREVLSFHFLTLSHMNIKKLGNKQLKILSCQQDFLIKEFYCNHIYAEILLKEEVL